MALTPPLLVQNLGSLSSGHYWSRQGLLNRPAGFAHSVGQRVSIHAKALSPLGDGLCFAVVSPIFVIASVTVLLNVCCPPAVLATLATVLLD